MPALTGMQDVCLTDPIFVIPGWLFGNVWDHFDLDLEIRTRQAMQCEHPNLGVPAFS